MNASLAQFLVEFSASKPPEPFELEEIEPVLETEPMISMSEEAFEQKLQEAREAAADEARAEAEATLSARFEEERAELTREFEAAREAWANEEGERISTSLTAAIAQLETELADCLAAVLRPLYAEAAQERMLAEMRSALKAILADPSHPPIRIEGPIDLLTAFGNSHDGEVAIDYVESEQAELSIVTETTRIETRLAACLAALQSNES